MGNGYCVTFSNNGLEDTDCNIGSFILCEVKGVESTSKTTNIRLSSPVSCCPSGWEAFNGYCYIVSTFQMKFAQAQAFCASLDSTAYLIKITSQAEIDFITSLLSDHTWVIILCYL